MNRNVRHNRQKSETACSLMISIAFRDGLIVSDAQNHTRRIAGDELAAQPPRRQA